MTHVLKKTDNLQLLISTKGKKDFTFLDVMFKNCDLLDYSILIVDQSKSPKDLTAISNNIEYYHIPDNGLSFSRNHAIFKSRLDLCLLCDDDVVFEKNFYEIIVNSFENNDFDDLMVDANRVRSGGQSSKSIAKAKKDAKNTPPKKAGGEEE